ncbi:MAG TPA: hypothetical protein VJM84_01410 [Actinomycetota bacterium]|nr:hypothetical protein [Actinomycetota bacterium]
MKRACAVALLVAMLLAIPGVANAQWSAPGAGDGLAAADVAPSGNQPTASSNGRNVTVDWTTSTFADGASVDGYLVTRYDAGTNVPDSIGANCSGTITTLTCTENAVDPGSWYYTITPKHLAWLGGESPASATVAVASPSLTFSSAATITALPSVQAGTIASFVTGETVIWRLDDPSTGPLLTGSIAPDPVPAGGSSTTSVTIPAGTADGIHTVYAIGSSGSSTASATVTVDTLPPVVSAAAIQKAAGGTPGYIRQNGSYRVYAAITDPGSPITTATANVSTITTGATASALTAGTWTIAGVTYNYRSAMLTANNPLAAGAKAFSVTATDSFAHTATTGGFSVMVDNTRPAGSSLTTANSSGGIVGKAETGDSITYTYNEPIDANSIILGWDGTATSVTLRLLNAGGGGGDRVQIWNAANSTQLPLGVVRLGSTGYTATSVAFTNSTMTISGNSVIVVLGTPGGAVGSAVVTSNTRWNPSNVATDWAGNACTNTAVNEPVPLDPEF